MTEHSITIYAFRNKETGKIYVGRTSRPLKFRFQEHMKLLEEGKHTSFGMQEDYERYGDCFEIYVLEVVKNPTRNQQEYEWMRLLETYDDRFGYNSQDMGVKKMRRAAGLYVPPSPLIGRTWKWYTSAAELAKECN